MCINSKHDHRYVAPKYEIGVGWEDLVIESDVNHIILLYLQLNLKNDEPPWKNCAFKSTKFWTPPWKNSLALSPVCNYYTYSSSCKILRTGTGPLHCHMT